jgi:uncharacterized membrane protein YgcG
MRRLWVLAAVAFCVLVGVAGRLHPAAPVKDFSEREVASIKAELAKLKPSSYRVVLPVFRNRVRVSSETVGTLPLTEVRRIASLRGVTLKEKGNLQVILPQGDESGGGGGGGSSGQGGGPGSHINSQSAGRDVINRIQLVVSGLSKSQYVFIH